jgi:hypothetical protein
MTISLTELLALRNLADKQAGESVAFINIADARALTDLGLAKRAMGGWEITQEGAALLQAQAAVEAPPATDGGSLISLRPPGGRT